MATASLAVLILVKISSCISSFWAYFIQGPTGWQTIFRPALQKPSAGIEFGPKCSVLDFTWRKEQQMTKLSAGSCLRGFFLALIAGFISQLSALPAQQEAGRPEAAQAVRSPAGRTGVRSFSVKKHTVTIESKPVPYTVTAGELTVLKPDEKPGATMFFAAYTRDDIKDLSKRPVTFAFNGGPGSSTLWLHLGGIGPKRVAMDDEGHPAAVPSGLTDSEFSLLDVTDLVFVDAVSTGYSRPLPDENPDQFHGVSEDAAAFTEFIRLYLTRFERWDSPKFLLGESYGTTRAAALSGYLQNRTYGIYLNGIILLSSVLDFSTLSFSEGNNLPYVVFLPHYTATARYHGRLSADYQAKPLTGLLEEARKFAIDEYAPALLKGNLLAADEYEKIAGQLSALSGLSVDYLKRANLRIRHDRFVKELLRAKRLTVGRLDSRFTGRDSDAVGESYEFDPSSAAIMGAFTSALNDYLTTELGYGKEIPYAVYGNVRPWNYSLQPSLEPGRPGMALTRGSRQGALNVAETLRRAMSENGDLKIFCCNGYYDGATPFFGTEYTFSQIMLDGSFKDRVSMGYYNAGHMMYIHQPSLKKLKQDLASFITGASTLREK